MTQTDEVRIETSTQCNYKCVFCPHKDNFNRKKEIMSDELFDLVMNKISQLDKQINVITLSGMGEVLLDKNIVKRINKIKKMGYKVNILTNGSLLTPQLIQDLKDAGLDSIRLSLHTTDSCEYKQITGAENNIHNNVMEMIELLVHQSTIELIISCDIVQINEKNVQNIIDKYSTRVDLLEIWKPHNWGNWGEYRDGKTKKKTCGRPEKGPIQIQVDGTLNMCCFDYNGELLIGDLKTNSIQEIYQSKEYNYIKECHTNYDKKDLMCSKCDQLYNSDPGIVIYNSKFNSKDRINKTSTNYEEIL